MGFVKHYLLPLLGGGLYALGYPSSFAPHSFVFPILGSALLWQAFDRGNKNILSLLCHSLGTCLVGFYWLAHTLSEFGHIGPPGNHILGLLTSLFIFPHYLVFMLLARWLRPKISRLKPFGRNALFATLLVVLEHFIPQMFAHKMGHSWLPMAPGLGLAPYFGVPLFSFASHWMAWAIVGRIRGQRDWLGIGFFAGFLLVNQFLPLPPYGEGTPTRVRLVQANIGHFVKRKGKEAKTFSQITQTYLDLSTSPENKADLVLWPETAYPKLLNSELMKKNRQFIPEVFRETVRRSGAQLILGGTDMSPEDGDYRSDYNSLFYFNRDGGLNNVYHKQILMPFGESLPFGPLNPHLAKIITNITYFAKGSTFPLFELDNGVRLINTICYEILFDGYIRTYLNRTLKERGQNAHFILNAANDSWYGDTSEPHQHQFVSHWRALEFQMPVVRITNTGLSSLLHPDGSKSSDLGLFAKKVGDFTLFTRDQAPTWYQRFGFAAPLALMLSILALVLSLDFLKPAANPKP